MESGRLRNEEWSAQFDGSINLIHKALDAFRAGDDLKVARMVTRAASFPWDDREEAFPGAWAAHMALFTLIADEVEDATAADAGIDPETPLDPWLTAALNISARDDGETRKVLSGILRVLASDHGLYPEELEAIVRHFPEHGDLAVPWNEHLLAADASVTDVKGFILKYIHATVAYVEELDRLWSDIADDLDGRSPDS